MKTKLYAVWMITILFATLNGFSASAAETPGAEPAAAKPAEPAAASPAAAAAALSRRMEDLQQEFARLQAELSDLKKQMAGSAASAPAAAPAAVPASPAALAAPAPAPASPAPVAAAAAPQAASGAAGFLSSISMSGTVDGYWSLNFNHPRPGTFPILSGLGVTSAIAPSSNGLRAFDGRDQAFSLNLAEINFDRAVDKKNPLGFHVALAYGDAINTVNVSDPGSLFFAQYLKEAYFSYLAPVGKGLQFDFGKFVTPAGAEVIETKDNWNYSRGLLFTFAIPFYHFGLRSKYTINDKASITGFLVNGWNNVVDNNSGKTYGASLALNPSKKLGITENYLVGPEQANTNSNWRQLTDTVVTYNPTGKLSLMTNFDYGSEKPCNATTINPCPGTSGTNPAAWWSGIAQYAKYAFDDANAVAVRYEYFNDHNNYALNGFSSPGRGQHIHEATITLEHTFAKHLIARAEYRRDVSNRRIFFKGAPNDVSTPTNNRTLRNQDTATIGLIYVLQ